MSRFRKLSHTTWHCHYHIVWVPKYRYRILTGRVSEKAGRCIHAFTGHQNGEVVELDVQVDHVHCVGAAEGIDIEFYWDMEVKDGDPGIFEVS